MKKIHLIVFLFFVLYAKLFSQTIAPGCATALPFCAGSNGLNFPSVTGVASVGSYSCLSTQPNPSWYFLQVSQSGPLSFRISQTTGPNGTGTGIDVDFIAWGPFVTPTCGSSNLNATTQIGCSYSALPTETFTIPNAVIGQYYVVLITNFSTSVGFTTLTQTNISSTNAGATSCDIVCPLTLVGGGVSDCRDNILTANYINSAQTGTTFSWTFNGGNINATSGPNFVATPRSNNSKLNTLAYGAGQYCVTALSPGCSSTQSAVCTTINRGLPVPFNPPINITACNNSTFDLTQNTSILLQGIPGNATNYEVRYNVNANNALTNTSPIPIFRESAFTGTEGQIIYATVMDNSSNYCIAVAQFRLNFITCAFATTNTGPKCAGSTFNLFASDPGVGSVTYSWTGPNGFTATGANVNNIPTPTGTPPFNYVCTATPSTPGSAPLTSTTVLTVNAIPVATATPVLNSICSGTTTDIPLVSNVNGTTFAWTFVSTNATGASNGTASNIAQPLSASGNSVGTVDYTITPSANGCTGIPIHSIISVKPIPVLTSAPSTICSGATSNISLSSVPTGASYAWTVVQTDVSGASPGSGTSIAQVLTTPGNFAGTADFTITPTLNSCAGLPVHSIVTVNPTAQVNQLIDKVVCNGNTTTAVAFTTNNTGGTTTYSWTNSDPTIGLAATGTGNITAFTAINIGTAPVLATIIVTPTYTNGTVSCTGPTKTFTITVNPSSQVNQPSNQVVCNGSVTTAVAFSTINTPGTTIYSWANSDPTIGLAATGTGDITAFTAINTGTAPVIATITVTPTYTNGTVSCTGTTKTFTITVNPSSQVNQPTDQVVCNGNTTTAVVFTTNNTPGTTIYSWANSDPTIGLAATGTGDITAFTAINTGTAPVIATITVTPTYTNGTVSCTGATKTFTITINPTSQVNLPTDQVVCNGNTTTAVAFSTINTGGTTTYSWTNSDPTIGLAASGTGDITAFTAINTGILIVATITVTPTYTNGTVSCTGATKTFTITVNPSSQVNLTSDQVVCNGSATSAVVFSTINTGGTTTYSWANSDPSIGLLATGTGDIAGFTATNTGTAPVIATITVTPTYTNASVSCTVIPKTFTITINPTSQVNQPTDQVVCNGSVTTAVAFSTINSGGTTTYSWANSDPTIGIAASGTGDIAAFTAINIGITPVIASITVTPTYTNGTVSCTGATKTFTITVNPSSQVNQPTNQVVCNGSVTTAVAFSTINSGGTTTYSWANSDPTIGLAASGTGDITAFTATNTGTAPVLATITVTPMYTIGAYSCAGPAKIFTITINPTSQVNLPTDQVVCNGNTTTAVAFSTINTGGTTTYSWTNSDPTIGLAASGTGNITAFTATNTGTAPVIATITVTPTYTNGTVSCTGATKTFTITVNPSSQVNQPSNQVVCNGSVTTAVVFTTNNTPGTTIYSWANSDPTIGLAATGTGDITAFTAINTGTAPVIATIIVTPTYTNASVSCTGPTKTFTITVNPSSQVNQPTNQVVCNGSATTAVVFTTNNTPGTTIYSWANSDPTIGLAATGTGDITAFTAINTGTAPVIATITVTPTYTNGTVSCTGATKTFTITINPTSQVNLLTDQVVCNGNTTTAVAFSTINTGGTTTYSWANSDPTIGLAATGTGDITAFTAINTGTAPVIATIIVTPTYTNASVSCTGPTKTFTITVNPSSQVNQPTDQVVCNGSATTAVVFTTNNTPGTTIYSWANSDPTIGLAATGTGDITAFTAINTGTAPVIATITVTPTYTNGTVSCTGPTKTFTITVNPSSQVNQPIDKVVCNGNTTTAVVFTTNNTPGTTIYSWANSDPTIGLAATGTGDITAFTAINTGTAPVIATITVTPTYTNASVSCTGPTKTFTITVNPSSQVNQPTNQVVCNGSATTAVVFTTNNTPGTTIYSWANSDPTIGLAATGTGDITAFTAINIGTAPVLATIIVTPTYTNGTVSCTGPTKTFTITVNPSSQVNQPSNQVVCNGSVTTAVVFTTNNTPGTTIYSWANSDPTIGLAATGTGDITAFTAINTGTAPVIATITVTPTYTDGTVSCTGASKSFTILVNPIPVINPILTATICSLDTTNISISSNAFGATYVWTSTATDVSGATLGSGNNITDTLTATSTLPGTVIYTITPSATGCTGLPLIATVIVNPLPTATITGDATICTNTSTFINFRGTPDATVTYTINGVTNQTVVLDSTGIASVSTGNLTTTTTYELVSIRSAGTPSCSQGQLGSIIITVIPVPLVNSVISSPTICSGQPIGISLSSNVNNATFNWTINPIGVSVVPGVSTGNIISQVITTTGVVQGSVTYSVIANVGSCQGPITPITITVNPIPVLTPSTLLQSVCSGTVSPIILSSNVAGTTFDWNVVQSNITGASNGSGSSIAQVLTATSNNIGEAVYSVTPSVGGCPGSSILIKVNVNPIPVASANTAVTSICSSSITNIALTSTVAATTFSWTVIQTGIFGASSGTGNSIGQTLTTVGNNPGSVQYTITPTFNGCIGTPISVPITVNPTPEVFGSSTSTICSGETPNISLFPSIAATTFSWTVNAINVLGAQSGTGIVINDVLTASPNLGTAIYTITPTANGCSGSSLNITVLVNPVPAPQIKNGVICVNQSTNLSFQNYIIDTNLSNANYDFVWYYNGVIISGAIDNSYEATRAGNYSVIATNSATGCKSVLAQAVVSASYPGTSINTIETLAFSDNATITVDVSPINTIYQYTLDNGPIQSSNIFSNVSPGQHVILVTDQNGCTNLTKLISIIGYPTYFTPNGDSYHDTWNIVGLGDSAKVFIYDRYGKLIKQISPSGEGWDGTLNGESMIASDYWFTVDYSEPQTGERKLFRSHFSLKR